MFACVVELMILPELDVIFCACIIPPKVAPALDTKPPTVIELVVVAPLSVTSCRVSTVPIWLFNWSRVTNSLPKLACAPETVPVKLPSPITSTLLVN